MAGFDVRGELLIGGQWVDATGEILKRQALRHERGRQDQGSRVDPSSLQPLLDNTDGRFSPDNPMGPYYGMFGRNTPFRLSVKAGRSALELPGVAGSSASTPDAAPLGITGALDLRWEGEADWHASGSQMLIGKWSSAGQRSYHLRLQAGSVVLHVATDGFVGAFAGGALPVLPRRAAVRGTVTIGADWVFRLYWAESLEGPWTQAGGDVVVPGAAPIFAGTSPLVVSPEQLDASPPRRAVQGRCHRAEVRAGIDGPVVAAPDFTAQPDGTASFTDRAGRTWTVTGTAAITNRRTRLMQELAAYPARWHPSGAHAWVEATTAGVLRRLRRGSQALQSTLRRRVPSGRPLAYWPMEDGTAATRAASALDGGTPLTVSGMDFASDASLPSSEALPVLGDASSLSGAVPGATASGWHVEMVYRLETLPATEQTMLTVNVAGGVGGVRQVRARVSAAAIRIEALDADGGVVAFFTHTGAGRGDFVAAWNRLQMFTHYNGSQTFVALAWREVVTGLWWVVYAPYTGTPGRITGVRGSWGADFRGMALGHLAAFDVGGVSASVPGVQIYEGSDSAYAGETAGARMQRLALEESYPITVRGPLADQERVGPQYPSPILDLLEEAADADGGILYEDRERLRLLYRGRTTMYNQRPALVLDYNEPGLAPPLEPTGDDDGTENDVTVTRANGSSSRAVLEEGALSVQAPPAGVGPYTAQTTLNLHSDEQTGPQAYWRLHHGTYEGRRYPQVRVMVHQAPPELLEQILAVDVGDRMVIRNPPRWVAPGDVELIVQGYEEVWASEFQWDLVFNCTPGQPWLLGAVEDPVYGRVDTDGSALSAAVTENAAAVTVLTPEGPVWVTAQPALTANPDFGTDLTGWAGNGAVIERVAAPEPRPFAGEWAMLVTPDGVAAFPNAGGTAVPVVPGQSYVASGWLRSATSREIDLNANWFTPAGAYLSTSANGKVVTAGEWVWFELTATAPVGAAFGNVSPTVPTSPPPTDVVWAHGVTLRPAGGAPQEFPFDVRAGGEVMTVTAITDSRVDSFGRTVAGGWGVADSGQAWTQVGAAADYFVGAGYAVAAQPATGIAHLTLLPAPGPDVDLYVDVSSSAVATGASLFTGPLVRAVDNNNHYQARVEFTTSGGVLLTLRERVGAVETVLGTYASGLTHVAGAWYRVRLQTIGSSLRAKVWAASAAEPEAWQITATDTSLTGAGSVGTRSYRNTGNTSGAVEMRFTRLRVVNPQRFTVQRSRNGVVKGHAAGTDVRLAAPTIVAL
ncbi:hypothetical protein ACIRPR_06590 [Streptomyces griseoflavus]|uniref:hypothetical protein n=1 Tax=Streptomyces griseoflavus TaxID=35619 RepID=UPI0038045464